MKPSEKEVPGNITKRAECSDKVFIFYEGGGSGDGDEGRPYDEVNRLLMAGQEFDVVHGYVRSTCLQRCVMS